MSTRRLIILGSGGHAKVLVDSILSMDDVKILGSLNPKFPEVAASYRGVQVVGNDESINAFSPDEVALVNGIGSVSLPLLRQQVFEKFKKYTFCTVIDRTAIVSPTARIGEGAQVLARAVVNADVVLGANCIVNTGAIVEHDCWIGDHVHVGPGVTLSGGVRIGACSHIGVGATVLQGITIGRRVVVAGGACVHKNLPDDTVFIMNQKSQNS